ncbi:hypothetical protein PZH42_29630, partial [Bacteroides cellulosilyticus]|nr:hypothetical protein [Bacteroides cellulosilyticus]
ETSMLSRPLKSVFILLFKKFLWTVDYSGVKRCNDLLKYLDWATDVTPENRNSYEMQARCLRVFYYNMLWHYFGNVPFYLFLK